MSADWLDSLLMNGGFAEMTMRGYGGEKLLPRTPVLVAKSVLDSKGHAPSGEPFSYRFSAPRGLASRDRGPAFLYMSGKVFALSNNGIME